MVSRPCARLPTPHHMGAHTGLNGCVCLLEHGLHARTWVRVQVRTPVEHVPVCVHVCESAACQHACIATMARHPPSPAHDAPPPEFYLPIAYRL